MSEDVRSTVDESGAADKPVELHTMTFLEVEAYFQAACEELADRLGFEPATMDRFFDAQFCRDFETAPRSLRRYWRDQQKTWGKITGKLEAARADANLLSNGDRFFYKHLLDGLDDVIAGAVRAAQADQEFADTSSAERGNPQADLVAMAVAEAFLLEGRSVTFGRVATTNEPSTDFGRAVQVAMKVFRPEGNNGQVADWNAPAKYAWGVVTGTSET